MPIQKLSKTFVDKAKYQLSETGKKSTLIFWDTEIKGLGLRIYPSEQKSYLIHYRNPKGRWRFHIIGDASYMTPQQARELARRKLYEAACDIDHGELRKSARQGLTVSELCDTYLERYAKKQKRSSRDDESRIELYIRPAFGIKKIDEIKRADVATLHNRIGKHSIIAANRTLSLISVIYKQALTWGFVSDDFPNPARGIKKFPEKSRERYLTQDEAARLLQTVDQEPDIRFRLFIRLCFHTAARKNELLSLLWEDVDFEGERIRFRFTKAGRDHFVKPAPDAWALLEQLQELKETNCPYVFPGTPRRDGNKLKPRGHVKDYKRQWQRARETAGLEDIHMHDLRRTAATWLAQSGISAPMLQRVLNHSDMAIVETYARISGDDTAGPFARLGEIMGQVEAKAKEKTTKVIPIKNAEKKP